MKIAVLSLSGGQDSVTVLSLIKRQGYELHALSFEYGVTSKLEVAQARKICNELNVDHYIYDAHVYKALGWYSALTSPEKLKIPDTVEPGKVPLTYAPMRNSYFLVSCSAFLESIALHKIEIEGVDPRDLETKIFMAANAIDYSGYPDCRGDYFLAAERFLQKGSKLWTNYAVPIQIETPLLHLSKKQITELGVRMHAPLHLTRTCYRSRAKACGLCPSCVLRIKGFMEAGYKDPIAYETDINWSGLKEIEY